VGRSKQAAAYKRVLWAVLGINAAMFLVELGAGVAAGSASLACLAFG
jgi:Co/Zn/Cd efflux system component